MSLIPLLTEFEEFSDGDQLLEDTFGLGIHPVDIFRPYHRSIFMPSRRRQRYIPYVMHKFSNPGRGKVDKLQRYELVPHVGKDGFQVCMDVSHFTPNELNVKVVDDTVVVEGKHEERKDDHGFIQRHFIRKYSLPEGFDSKDVTSTISSDGVLTVKASPLPSKAKSSNERIVQIHQTGPAHLSVKQPEELKNLKNVESAKNGTE